MADETVDPNYKLFYNIGYVNSHFRNTSELLEKMIEKAPRGEAEAMRDGRREYNREALRRQADKMTAPQDDRVLSWQKQRDLDMKEGRDTPEANSKNARSPEQEAALLKEWQKQARSTPPEEPEPPSPSAPGRTGYQMTEKEKREYQQFEKEQEDRSRRQPYKEGTERIEKAAEESGNYADAAIEKHIQDDKQKNADLHEKHKLEAQEEAKRVKKAPEKDRNDDGRGR